MIEIRPQIGFQQNFLGCPADVVVGGGAAGAGKSFALLLEAIRYMKVPGYGGVIFRRTTPMIRNEGGLWSESTKLYPGVGLTPTESTLEWKYSNGNKIKFAHMEYEKNVFDWQGSQIPFIGFDELTHFTKKQFFYMLSRNRSMCGVKPYIRATCNPDPDSRLREFIDWYIGEDGYIIKERDGQIRYFYVHKDNTLRGNSKQEVYDQIPEAFQEEDGSNIENRENLIKSFCFIEGSLEDNKILLKSDPGYKANLLAQDEEERRKLLDKNRNETVDDLCLFDYKKLKDLTTNYITEENTKEDCITVDVARFGRDLTVIGTGTINHIKRIDIYTKSSTTDSVKAIETVRREYGVGQSQCLVDEDGVGGGVVDGYSKQIERENKEGEIEVSYVTEGGYEGFHGGIPAKPDPLDISGVKENYKNLKTQCAYRLAKYINTNNFRIDQNFYVDGVKSDTITLKSKTYNILDLINKDLKSFKRFKADMDGKKQIIPKAEQKILLQGRSPDFGDMLLMRIYFDLIVKVYYTM